MRLLFDENLSPALPRLLAEAFPGANHVSEMNLAGQPDTAIWNFARENSYCVVTKDRDFSRRSGYKLDCKVIWLRLGNCPTEEIVGRLKTLKGRISYFLEDEKIRILEVY